MMRRIARCAMLVVPTGLFGCAAESPKQAGSISAGLSTLESSEPAAHAALIEPPPDETTRRLDLMEQALRHAQVSVDPPQAEVPASARRGGARRHPPAAPTAGGGPASDAGEPASHVAPAASSTGEDDPGTLTDDALVAELASRLRDEARSSSSPAAALIRLAALELIDPAAGWSAGDGPALSQQEAEFVKAWRDLFATAREGLASSGDVAALAGRITELAERVGATGALSVRQARLCVRVDGYGMYDELPRRGDADPYPLVAGRRHRAIVYAELLNFASSPATEGGVAGYEVRLTQELSLFHAAKEGDTRVWHRPAREIVDFSRNRRKDFFVTQIIDLPANLSVGSYRLKVSLTDKASGASAEAQIPIEFLAESPGRR